MLLAVDLIQQLEKLKLSSDPKRQQQGAMALEMLEKLSELRKKVEAQAALSATIPNVIRLVMEALGMDPQNPEHCADIYTACEAFMMKQRG
jgi:hypothetical protein